MAQKVDFSLYLITDRRQAPNLAEAVAAAGIKPSSHSKALCSWRSFS